MGLATACASSGRRSGTIALGAAPTTLGTEGHSDERSKARAGPAGATAPHPGDPAPAAAGAPEQRAVAGRDPRWHHLRRGFNWRLAFPPESRSWSHRSLI